MKHILFPRRKGIVYCLGLKPLAWVEFPGGIKFVNCGDQEKVGEPHGCIGRL